MVIDKCRPTVVIGPMDVHWSLGKLNGIGIIKNSGMRLYKVTYDFKYNTYFNFNEKKNGLYVQISEFCVLEMEKNNWKEKRQEK